MKVIISILILSITIFANINKEIIKKLEIEKNLINNIKDKKEDILKYKKNKNYYILGLLSLKNQRTKLDQNLSYNYFKKSADLGHYESQRIVSLMFYYGIGVKKNKKEAKKYMKKSYENYKKNYKFYKNRAQVDWVKYNYYFIK
jgi:TPR repeat protein